MLVLTHASINSRVSSCGRYHSLNLICSTLLQFTCYHLEKKLLVNRHLSDTQTVILPLVINESHSVILNQLPTDDIFVGKVVYPS